MVRDIAQSQWDGWYNRGTVWSIPSGGYFESLLSVRNRILNI